MHKNDTSAPNDKSRNSFNESKKDKNCDNALFGC